MRPIWGPGPKPSLLQLYLTVARESYYVGQAQSKALPGYWSAYYVESAMNRLMGESAPDWGRYSIVDAHSRGVGGPSGTPPTSTVPSKASSGRAMAQAKKSGGPRQVSQRGGRARGKCPKGHYWSFKQKKCVKSKFR